MQGILVTYFPTHYSAMELGVNAKAQFSLGLSIPISTTLTGKKRIQSNR